MERFHRNIGATENRNAVLVMSAEILLSTRGRKISNKHAQTPDAMEENPIRRERKVPSRQRYWKTATTKRAYHHLLFNVEECTSTR
jgi:hypothetical protein